MALTAQRACLAVGLVLASIGTAYAGTLYVCKGANGVKAYQDTPCPDTAKTVGTGTFKSTPYAPPVARAVQPPADPQPAPQARPQQPTPVPVAQQPVGWICETGSRQWLQFSPCPATYMRAQAVDVDGHIAGTAVPVHGTGSINVPTPVQSTPLGRAGVCAALGDRSIRVSHHGSSDTYERGILRSKYCD